MGHHRHSQSSMTKQPKESELLTSRHHIFTIELFLDETGKTSEVFIVHSQSGEKENLTSWQPEKVIDFVEKHTGLQTTRSAAEVLVPPRRHSTKAPNNHSSRELSFDTPASMSIVGKPCIQNLRVTSTGSDTPNYIFPESQPFTVHIALDLTEVTGPRKTPLLCEAKIIARQPGGPNITAAEAHKRLELSNINPTISVNSAGLPAGLYRLDALVKLRLSGTEHEERKGAVAYLEGMDLIEIY